MIQNTVSDSAKILEELTACKEQLKLDKLYCFPYLIAWLSHIYI